MLPLHHVGVLVADIATEAESLASRFGYVIESEVIEDPVQTALVQFLRQPGAPYWLELVAPNGESSKLRGALRKGGGTHHLCYEVVDIGLECSRLRELGMMVISEPVPAAAFSGRRIAWLMDRAGLLVELVEAGPGALSLATIRGS